MAEFIIGKENYLPIKTEITRRRTGAEAGTLVTDGDMVVGKMVEFLECAQLVFDKFEGVGAEVFFQDRFEMSFSQMSRMKMDFFGIVEDD